MTQDFIANVAPNIRTLRMVKGYSQSEIAERLNISRSTYSAYEAGRTQPSLTTMLNLCDIYECSLDALISGDIPKHFGRFIQSILQERQDSEAPEK